MDFNFKGFKDKLSAQVDSSKDAILRRSVSPRQALNTIIPDIQTRTRKVSDASSVASEASSVANFDSNYKAMRSEHSASNTNLNSSQLSLNTTFDSDVHSVVNFHSVTFAPGTATDGEESASEFSSTFGTHIPSVISENAELASPSSGLPRKVSSSSSSKEDSVLMAMPTEQELEMQKTQILANFTTDQIVVAFIKNKVRLQNYKTTLRKSKSQNEELNKDQHKLTQLLETTQDKYMKKIAEMKEASQLDKEAKAHLEAVLQGEIDEKSMIIESLNQKIALLKSGRKTPSEENIDEIMSQKDKDFDALKRYENFCTYFQNSFHRTAERFTDTDAMSNECSNNVLQEVAGGYIELMKKFTDDVLNESNFDSDQIQTSLEQERKLNSVYEKCYQLSAIVEKEAKVGYEKTNQVAKEVELLRSELDVRASELKKSEEIISNLREQMKCLSEAANSEDNEVSNPPNDNIERLKNENSELTEKCEKLSKENFELEQKLRVELETVSKANESKEVLENEKSRLGEQLSLMESKIAQFSQEVIKKSERIDNLETKNNEFMLGEESVKSEIEELKSEKIHLERKLIESENELATLRDSHEKITAEVTEKESNLELLNSENNRLKTSNAELILEIDNHKSHLSRLETELKQKSDDFDVLNEKLNATSECLVEVDALREECLKLKDDAKNKEQTLSDLQNAKSNLETCLAESYEQIKKLNCAIVDLENSKNKLLQKLEVFSSKNVDSSESSAQNGNVVAEESMIAEELMNVEESPSIVESSSEIQLDVNQTLNRGSDRLGRCDSIEESTQTQQHVCDLMSCSNDKSELQAELTNANARIEELIGKIEMLSRNKYEVERLTSKIETLTAEKEALEQSVVSISKDRDSKISSLDQQIKSLMQEIECKNNEFETLASMAISSEEFDKCELENVEIKRNFHQLMQEFESMKEKLELEKQEAVNELEINLKDSFNKEKRTLMNEKLELNKELERLKSQVTEFDEQIESIVASKKEIESNLEKTAADLNFQLEENDKLKRCLDDNESLSSELISKDDYLKIIEEKTSLDLAYSELSKKLEMQTESFSSERQTFNNKIESLEKAFAQADSNATKVSSLLEQYEKSYEEKIAKLLAEQGQQETEVKFLRSSLEDAEAQCEDLKKEYEEKLKKIAEEKASLLAEIQQFSSELHSKQLDIDSHLKTIESLKEKVANTESAGEQQKAKFDDYKKKVEEKFSSQKQIISEKFKSKDKELAENKALIEDLDNKLKLLAGEKENLAAQKIRLTSEVEKMSEELVECQKLLNSTLEQSQNDVILVRSQLEEQVKKYRNEIEKLEAQLERDQQEKFGDLESTVEKLKTESAAKDHELSSLKEEVKKLNQSFEEEKQSTNKSHYVERNKLSADVKLLQNEKSEVEMTLANVKKDYQKYQMKMEDSVKKFKEQIENLKAAANREKLNTDREIKLQFDEVAKLRDALQKSKSKHADEVSEIKSKHASLVKSLDDQIRETKGSLQKTIDNLRRNHEDEISKLTKNHKEELTQLRLDHQSNVKNLLLEFEEKAAVSESELSKSFQDEIDNLKHQIAEKDVANQDLQSEVADLNSKLQKETLAATLSEYKQKYEMLMLTSQNDLKRLEKQSEQKLKAMENKFNEDHRVLEKQVQEQKLIIANLEFEIQDLESNYNAERSRNELLSKDAKSVQKSSELKVLLDAKESEIQRMEQSIKSNLKAKEAEFEDRLKFERDKIVREMDEFYSEKYQELVLAAESALENGSSPNDNNNVVKETVVRKKTEPPAILTSPSVSMGSDENLFNADDYTQMQFLRNILRQFIMGQEKEVMAKVLVKFAKFDDQESRDLLKAVRQSQKWIPL